MTAPFIMLVDDEVPFVETTAKRLTKRNIETISGLQRGRRPGKTKRRIKTSMSLSWMSRCQAWMGLRR